MINYTWGYLKDVALAKLDLDDTDALNDGSAVSKFLSSFPAYANEVITQICSSIKPKYTFAQFNITEDKVGVAQKMPADFISFGDDVCYELVNNGMCELYDTDFKYDGYNHVIFARPGKFYISYNARWCTFDMSNPDNIDLSGVPYDVLECIPSYIASQCFKVDDEYKAQVFRNEYELMLARIDATNYKNSKTIKIKGDW